MSEHTTEADPSIPVEIERKFLLRCMPPLPREATTLNIQQGYLAIEPNDSHVGRIRSTRYPDGRVQYKQTIKRGTGLVREEIEHSLTAEEFATLWPETEGRRIYKKRHRVMAGDLEWVIDEFEHLDLVLAEVELPDVDTLSPPPEWLGDFIVKEVTDDPAYTNANLARLLADSDPNAP